MRRKRAVRQSWVCAGGRMRSEVRPDSATARRDALHVIRAICVPGGLALP